jgi:hypothetical protein
MLDHVKFVLFVKFFAIIAMKIRKERNLTM